MRALGLRASEKERLEIEERSLKYRKTWHAAVFFEKRGGRRGLIKDTGLRGPVRNFYPNLSRCRRVQNVTVEGLDSWSNRCMLHTQAR